VNGAFVTDVNGTGYIDGGDLLNDPRWENGVDNGGNGYADDLVGWDFVNNDNDPMDDFFHGTLCAGIIGAVGNNNEGGAGIAWRVQMMATKILDAIGAGDGAEIEVAGVRYAVDNGARVTNNSWGSTNPTKRDLNVYRDAVNYAAGKGVLWTASAANNSWDNDHNGSGQNFPSSLDSPNIIAVAATTFDDALASFSNYGLISVDLAAPGENVGSTIPVYQQPEFPYGRGVGTSFSAPFVAGTAALLLARNPNQSYAQLKDRILSNVDTSSTFQGLTVTGGRLNVSKALAAVPSPAAAIASSNAAVFSTTPVSPGRELLATRDELLA
jgi:subtilisin family serine protease